MKKSIFIFFTAMYLSASAPGLCGAAGDSYELIIEKNLFHPDRKAWIMEATGADKDKAAEPKPKKDVARFELMGTIIIGESRRAIIRTSKKRSKAEGVTYLMGDYIEGYFLQEIDAKKVVLNNKSTNEEITIFLHEGKTSRSAQKTEIPKEAFRQDRKEADGRQAGKKTSAAKAESKRRYGRKKVQTTSQLQNRLKRDLKALKRSVSNQFVRKQAEKDLKKLENVIAAMSDEERREMLTLKQELEQLIQK